MDSIHVNGFSLGIKTEHFQAEKIIHNNAHYFALPDDSGFTLVLDNSHPVKVDAHVYYNGYKMGVWRILPESKVFIKRSDFFIQKGVGSGVIKVVFKPGRYVSGDPGFYSVEDPTYHNNRCGNYTGGERRCQIEGEIYNDVIRPGFFPKNFRREPLRDINRNMMTTIYARVVVDDSEKMYMRKYSIHGRAPNRVPPPTHNCSGDQFFLSKKYYFDTI